LTILKSARDKILVLDGALGTMIQSYGLPPGAYGGKPGCLEHLVLSAPDVLRRLHRAYLEAGADIITTNTFGANPMVLAEYQLEPLTEEINRAAVRLAKDAAAEYSRDGRPRFVAGSIGPGTKLPTLGQIDFETLYQGYLRQIEALIEVGVDLLILETCQDLLQIKAALIAAQDIFARAHAVPIYVSVTIESTGVLLTGSDIGAVAAVLSAFPVDVLGLNCATGPQAMRPHLEVLAQQWAGLIGLYPNAGLPQPTAAGVVYPEQPAEFAQAMSRMAGELPINIVGGCCGTTPEHMRRLAQAVEGKSPRPNRARPRPVLASLYGAVDLRQVPPPLIVGERANATGGKDFRNAILAADYDRAFEILVHQEDFGAHAADLSTAYAGQDEARHMAVLISRAARECRLPLFIDSNNPEVVELALKRYPGRAAINSINLEDGGVKARQVCALAKRHGAALIALTIDEQGMALTADRKVEVARRLVELCTGAFGLRPEDLLIDPLTFTVGSGEPSLKTAAIETLEAVRRIKREIPGVLVLLGLSNVSFGLATHSRWVLNSVFLNLALAAGADATILHPKHILPLAAIDETDKQRALDLIYNRPVDGRDPLEAFIDHFAQRPAQKNEEAIAGLAPAEAVAQGIQSGKWSMLGDNLNLLLAERSAESILGDVLAPAMKRVGELFGAGQMQLPFVLKSAEAMKRAVDQIKPHFSSAATGRAAKKLLLATVRGDVHDIGKNLVEIIVGNNGFEVINLGVKVPVETILLKALESKADAIGMSGLLVSSVMIMAENLRAMAAADFTTPVLVGGAALTPEYVRDTLQPSYPGRVIYCANAFDGLTAMQHLTEPEVQPEVKTEPVIERELRPPTAEPWRLLSVAPPQPPFFGARLTDQIELDAIFGLVDEKRLFRSRWNYHRGQLDPGEFERMLEKEARPRYRELTRLVKIENLFEPRIAYGYFPARRAGDTMLIKDNGRELAFQFPRQYAAPFLCLADFFRTDRDVAGFFVVTLGDGAATRGRKFLDETGYLNYFLLHGLAVEASEALAEYAYQLMRRELGIEDERRLDEQGEATSQPRGQRFGFGYPACPDLSANQLIFEILKPERIGVELSEAFQIIPEYSTTALVVHHPQAKYFSV